MEPNPPLFAWAINRWTTTLAGAAAAASLVWYLGPLVPGLDSALPRAIAVAAIALAWSAANGVVSWRRRQRERALAAGVAGEDRGPDRDAADGAAEEVSQLRARMDAALARLRGDRRRRGYLYEQPWFVLIGPPGSGKTTALRNSGLRFPLTRDEAEELSVSGVGGTQLCDWWFADEAVLIDTAGRYTTQDSDAAVDRAGWQGFLDMLRRTRPRQPVNGVLVVISVTDIADAAEEERDAHARAVRRRVKELCDRLGQRLPVYMLFSKADRLAGFTEYFDDLDAEARAQVWGATFPLAKGVDAFAPEFRALLERLDARLLDRLQAERAPDRRAMIAGFPLQAAALAGPLERFLRRAFGGTKLDPAPFLRGVYLTSATQEGTPIDRLTGLLARSFGVDQKSAPGLRPVAGRSYFLRRLLRDVVLEEALLVSARSARERRRRWLRAGGFAASALLLSAGGLALWRAEAAGRDSVARAAASLAAFRGQVSALRLDPVSDDELPEVAAALDTAAASQAGAGAFVPVPGLAQDEKLRQVGAQAYRDALRTVLLPRLVWRLEAQMRARFGDADFLYGATRVYLMLGGAGPLDPPVVRDWETRDWEARFPGALNAGLRERLARHLDALLAEPLPEIALDGGLVGAARATFSRVPVPARVYGRIRAAAADATVPDWSPAEALGPGGAPLFVRRSGAGLGEGIPGFYTADGFRRALLGRLAGTARAVAGESWVLGRTEEIPSQGPALVALERAVVALYVQDAAARWDALLADLALAPVGGRDSAVQRLYVLSSPQSPMRDLLSAVVRALALRPPPPADGRGQPAADPVDPVVAEADAAIGARFAALRELMGDGRGDGRGDAPFSGLLRLIGALQSELSRTGASGSEGSASVRPGGESASLLLAEAGRQPAPVNTWLRQIAETGRGILGGNAADAVATAFAADSGPAALCRQVVDGRYPFDPAGRSDAPLDDFARLFAPNGVLDAFFQTRVKPYADTRGQIWRPQAPDGIPAPVDAAALARFQRAAAIRDALFPAGDARIRYSVVPLPTDGDSKAVLTIGGARIADPAAPVALTWPDAGSAARAELAFDPADGGPPIRETGSWALFRLLARAEVARSGSGEVVATFRSAGRAARFGLRTESSRNPFKRNLLEGFRCPAIR